MDTWIFIAATAYFLNAVAFVIDKYLLALPIPKPFTYAVWVAMLSTPVVLLIPFFDIFIPSVVYFAISFASGTAFFVGLIFLYKAIQKSDVSVASTQAGVLTSVFTYLFSFFILGTAFVLLYYAILLGNVVIINALLGLQFLFVFLLAIALRNKLSGIEENMERKALAIKSVGIALVLSGFLAILI